MLDVLKDAAAWMLDQIAGLGQNVITGAVGALTFAGVPPAYLGQLIALADQLNFVFPLNETVGMSSALLSLWTAVRISRWAIKLVPFIG